MKKLLSIKSNRDFLFAYRKGKSFVNPILITYINKNRKGTNYVGVTTSKKIGNAVERNRARRVIKAAYQNLSYELKQGYDIVFVARSKTSNVKMDKVLEVMEKQLLSINEQAGIDNKK
ncbi:MAG: ribonuclease P protein component [Oscillospiraceae bacterium]